MGPTEGSVTSTKLQDVDDELHTQGYMGFLLLGHAILLRLEHIAKS